MNFVDIGHYDVSMSCWCFIWLLFLNENYCKKIIIRCAFKESMGIIVGSSWNWNNRDLSSYFWIQFGSYIK